MSETQDHVNKLRHAYQLWNDTRGGSVQTWLGLFTDDIVIRSLGDENPRLEFAKSRQGKSGAEQYFAELDSSWEMVYFTPEEFIAQDNENHAPVENRAAERRCISSGDTSSLCVAMCQWWPKGSSSPPALSP
jgi:ketosteroid isomerase-like protein